MKRFSWLPTHSQAIVMAVGVLLMMVIGTIVFVAHGHFQWFFVVWYLVGVFVFTMAVRRARATRS